MLAIVKRDCQNYLKIFKKLLIIHLILSKPPVINQIWMEPLIEAQWHLLWVYRYNRINLKQVKLWKVIHALLLAYLQEEVFIAAKFKVYLFFTILKLFWYVILKINLKNNNKILF